MSAREERVARQLYEWKNGNSAHNDVDDECCPDFSCCTPKLQAPQYERDAFVAAYEARDERVQLSMLAGFLGRLVPGAHIVEDPANPTEDQC